MEILSGIRALSNPANMANCLSRERKYDRLLIYCYILHEQSKNES